MSIGKLAVVAVALMLVSGGVGAALADWDSPQPGPAIDLVDVDARKADDDADGTVVADEEGDGDDNAANDDPAGALNVPPQPQPQRAGDGDQTAGNDGTAGGNNTQADPVLAQPIPAGAGQADDAGGGGGGGDDTGGGETD